MVSYNYWVSYSGSSGYRLASFAVIIVPGAPRLAHRKNGIRSQMDYVNGKTPWAGGISPARLLCVFSMLEATVYVVVLAARV